MTHAERSPQWYIVDARQKHVGRLASGIAFILQGKHNPAYTPHVLSDDHLVVINADKVVFTGKKWEQKEYIRHTGFTGGLKRIKASKVFEKNPEHILEKAVRGMLPKSKLARHMFKKLRVYAGEKHPHAAQQPQPLTI